MQRAHLGLLITGSCLFFSMGSALAMYGPIFPELRAMFGLDAADAGALASAHFVGAFAGIVLWSLGERRGASRLMLTGSAALLVLGPLLIVTAPSFALARAGAAIVGIGYGSSTLGVHRLFAVLHGDRATGPLNLVNATFGVSCIVGPLAVGMVAGPAKQYLFAGPALLALITVPLALASPAMAAPAPGDDGSPGPGHGHVEPAVRGRGDRLAMVLFMAVFLLYVATESSIGAWETSYLAARGYSDMASASWSAAFWAGLATGRMLAVPVSLHLSPRWMVMLCLGLGALALVGTRAAGMEPAAFTAAGLALAPIFPTSFAWLTRTFPTAAAVGGLAVGAGMVGGIAGPLLVGLVVTRHGAAGVPWTLAALALASFGCALWLHRRARRAT
jgi:FHS family glucose/mannose:H+ symporter-like MFS transporter